MPDASHIGRRYEAAEQTVEPEAVAAFAAAIAGDDPVFEPEAVPPTFAAVYCLFPTLAQLFGDAEVGISLAGLVHGEQSFEWPTPVRVGDRISATAEIAAVEEKRGMTFVGIDHQAHRGDGAVVCRGRSLMIVRGGGA